MATIALICVKKAAPFVVFLVLGLGAGLYFGYLIGSEGLAAARLAVSVQQAADAKAVASANETATAELAKANADANTAEAALALADKKASAVAESLTAQISAQAAQPGLDAPDAPVLGHTLDALKASQ